MADAVTAPRTPWALLERIAPYLDQYREQLVLVGGLAKRLYRSVDGFAAPMPPSENTKDVDFALSDPLVASGVPRLHELLVKSGLKPKVRTGLSHATVACSYYAQEVERPTALDPHLEFISPLRGPDREEPVSRPQGDDLHANPLRFVDLLLDSPIPVIDPQVGKLLVPHPLAYIVQRTRIRDRRQQQHKQARDQADAFYVVLGFQSRWGTWKPITDRWRQNHEWSQWLAQVGRTWDSIYASQGSPGAREVATADEFKAHFTASDVIRIMADFRAAISL